MIIKKCFILVTLISLCFSPNILGSEYYYIMKPGESLSRLLYKNDIKPIYHKWGSLRALEEYNIKTIFNSDYVLAGQKVFFPTVIVRFLKKNNAILISKNNEIFFKNKTDTNLRLPAHQNSEVQNPLQENPLLVEITKSDDSSENSNSVDEKNISTENSKKVVINLNETKSSQVENFKPKPVIAETEKEQSNLSIAIGSGYSRIDSIMNSGKAVLLSKPTSNIKLDWEQLWSKDFHTSISWGYESIPFQSANVGSIYNNRQNLTHFELGLSSLFFNKLWFGLYFGQKENVFITSNIQSTATLESIANGYTRLSLNSELIRRKKLSFFVGLDVSSLAANSMESYDVKSGTSISGQLTIKQQFRKFSFFMTGEYQTTNQNTSITSQSGRDIKSYLGISMPLGGGVDD